MLLNYWKTVITSHWLELLYEPSFLSFPNYLQHFQQYSAQTIAKYNQIFLYILGSKSNFLSSYEKTKRRHLVCSKWRNCTWDTAYNGGFLTWICFNSVSFFLKYTNLLQFIKLFPVLHVLYVHCAYLCYEMAVAWKKILQKGIDPFVLSIYQCMYIHSTRRIYNLHI